MLCPKSAGATPMAMEVARNDSNVAAMGAKVWRNISPEKNDIATRVVVSAESSAPRPSAIPRAIETAVTAPRTGDEMGSDARVGRLVEAAPAQPHQHGIARQKQRSAKQRGRAGELRSGGPPPARGHHANETRQCEPGPARAGAHDQDVLRYTLLPWEPEIGISGRVAAAAHIQTRAKSAASFRYELDMARAY